MQQDQSGNNRDEQVCSICGKSYLREELVTGAFVRPGVRELILRDRPDWSPKQLTCRVDLNRYRWEYVRRVLESERGALSSLEEDVLASLRQHEVFVTDVESRLEGEWTLGERLADRLAAFSGSWMFLGIFAVFMAVWIVLNTIVLWWRPIDPYPFIFLNLLLSCMSAVWAPIILMSQNRQEAKDRLRSRHAYQVNLKAELEIRHLQEKVDHMLYDQWQRMLEIQEIQVELLAELTRARTAV
jgi:uncharacterized membrane protein